MESCSSDPTVATYGPLIQRVAPTVRNSGVTKSNRKGITDFQDPTDFHVHEKQTSDDDEHFSPIPNYGSTNLLFSDCTNDCMLSSTPKSTAKCTPPDSDTARLGAQISELQCRLRVQTDTNRELKRLLVASMGSDLQYRLNQIAEEKATISQNLDDSLHRLAEHHEEMDRVSIKCDIWRSKFIASRLMIDELAGWKAEITRQLKESQKALQCMLRESTELGSTLVECSCHLKEVVDHLKLKGRHDNASMFVHDNFECLPFTFHFRLQA